MVAPEFLLPAALRVRIRSWQLQKHLRLVPWSWEEADESVGTTSSH